MKKYTVLLLVIFLTACKSETKNGTQFENPRDHYDEFEEIDALNRHYEKNLLEKISSELAKELDQKAFTTQCLPVVNRLHKVDSTKYKMIHIIATKLSKESNAEAFQLGMENLKKEITKSKKK
ncbi:MAG: hypothetical protein ABJL44_01090 [Algibacter sp.]